MNIKVDKSAPTLGTVTLSSTSHGITVSGSATDSIAGLDAYPYRYTIGASPATTWLSSSSYTSQNLLVPNTRYSMVFEAKDAKGHIASSTQSIYTKAETSNVTVNNPTSYTLDVNTSDNNPSSTLYQICINGTQYLTQEGMLTVSPVWITLTNKKITAKGLSPSTSYTFTAKAKNAEGIETAFSAPVSGTTKVAPPPAPININATATYNSITLTWDAAAGATGYEIEENGTVLCMVTGTIYTHSGLLSNTQYTYRVRARNDGDWGRGVLQ